jgi:hypothetical protein
MWLFHYQDVPKKKAELGQRRRYSDWLRAGRPKSRSSSPSKKKVKLSLCLTNYALRHEGVWGSGCVDQHFLTSALAGDERSVSRPGRFTPRERAPGTQCTGDWVDPRAGLDDVEERKFLTLPEFELRLLGCLARS